MSTVNILIQKETIAALNSLKENIFVADNDFFIVWMNEAAHQLITSIKEDIHLTRSEDMIGTHLSLFHSKSAYQEKILKHHLPYKSRIHIFNKYSADISVTQFINEFDEKVGYILTWDDVTEQEQVNQDNQKLIDELSTPILPMVVEDSLLVPLIGTYDTARLDKLQQKLSHECSNNGVESVVFDFSAMSLKDPEQLINQIKTLSDTIALIGAVSVYVGFPIPMIREFVGQGVRTDVKTFRTFRQAALYLLKQRGLEIAEREQ
ncbi:hypothetical protein [Bacillus sp. FJAT-45037]|uniref:hypothetical protein n=1 Tax=Bacillus sp. FJAT-45037 TaxID=2011007 RepID=UPI000C24500E|nr:hypothetical protein [Bacillus sp. FJAT-45037]